MKAFCAVLVVVCFLIGPCGLSLAADAATIKIEGLKDVEVTVQDEDRKLALKGGSFKDAFKEYEVHIYEIAVK